jgi:signal transduction histidine kinase
MNTAAIMKRKGRMLLPPYEAALCRYLGQGPSASVKPALRLGRRAVALGLETLDLALIHEQALMAKVLSIGSAADRRRIIKRARAFFAETIVPMEETHRSALEANVHLNRLNRALNRRTLHLTASSLQLQREITQGQAVEETLRKSERHTHLLLEESRRLQQQLRLLSRRVLSAQEEERKRISRELHDVIAQMLTGINVRLATLKKDAAANTKGLSQKISRTQRLVEKSVDIVHQFARELRPAALDDLGLIPALHAFMKKFTKETGVRASLTAFAGVESLSSAKRTALYRVAQEALTNVDRHAHASRVDVSIQRFHKLVRMQIQDDGQSFEVDRMWHARKSRRLGLLGMRERVEMVGGKLTIESVPGKGTTIQAQIPFTNGVKEHVRL